MLTHSYYEEDPRVRREAECLAAAGYPVDVFALRQPGAEPAAMIDGVAIRRLDVQRHQGASLGTYLREYVGFFVRAAFALAAAHRHRRYALVQVHTLPDFLVGAALPLRLAGVPVLLDLHEAMPEFFRSRFPGAAHPLVHRALLVQERLSIALATHTQTVNEALADRLVRLGVPAPRVSVVRNSASLARFDPALHARRAFAADGVLRLVYAGAVTPTYELDVALEALARIRADRPDLEFVFDVFGRGDSAAPLAAQAQRLGLQDFVAFHGRIPIEAVPAAIAAADVGLAPTRRDPFTDISLSTKIFEYGAMGKPAVCSRLPMVERTFQNDEVWTYEPGNPVDLAATILRVADDAAGRDAAVGRAAERVAELAWEEESRHYLAIVDGLVEAAS
jgi:glycosyltransferase involved in cell wall biosynthesis